MLERLTINLSKNEKQALEAIAISELRNLREQVRFILRQEFTRRGLLQSDPAPFATPPSYAPSQDRGGQNAQ